MSASRSSVVIVVVCTAVLAATAGLARAENWARFRGPNGSGVSGDAVPVKWTDRDYAWRIELPGVGHSSPVVWDSSVFVTSADEDAGSRMLLCVDANTGRIRWTHDVDFKPYRKHGENSFASSTPAVDEKHVYVMWMAPDASTLVAINHDGKEAWRADLGPYKAQHGGGGSPIVDGGLVVVAVDQDKNGSFVAAFDRETGEQRWRTPRDSTRFSTSTPCVMKPKGNGPEQLVFTTHANGFTSLDPETGRLNWELPGTFDDRVVSSPVVAGDLVVGTAGEGARGKTVVAVRPPGGERGAGEEGKADGEGDGKADGGRPAKPEVAYKLSDEIPYVPTPLAHDGRLFTWSDSGTVSCFDAATGERLWSDRVRGAGYFASPICAGGKLYNVSKRGEVVVVSATGDKFELLARNELAEATDATPAVSNGRLYFRTLSHLICVGKPDRTASANGGATR